ncbi:hypothetical protein BROUX41_002535 [Berkeleyomyces rouxiae]
MKLDFPSAAVAIMIRFVYSIGRSPEDIKKTEEGYKDLATCVQILIMADKYAMANLHNLVWPQVLKLAEAQLHTTPATVLRAIQALYDGIPERKVVAQALVEMVANDFEKLQKAPEIIRFAEANATFGWQLSISLQTTWQRRLRGEENNSSEGAEA